MSQVQQSDLPVIKKVCDCVITGSFILVFKNGFEFVENGEEIMNLIFGMKFLKDIKNNIRNYIENTKLILEQMDENEEKELQDLLKMLIKQSGQIPKGENTRISAIIKNTAT